MSQNAIDFYLALSTSREVSPLIQERMFKLAKASGSDLLMAKLAQVSNLLPELDRKIRQTAGARALAAWASRPERTLQEIEDLASSTRSISVAKALAEQENLPSGVYEKLLRFNNANVAYSLATNPSTSSSVRVKCAPLLAANNNHRRAQRLAPFLGSDEDFLKAYVFAEEKSSAALLSLAQIADLPEDIQESIVEEFKKAKQSGDKHRQISDLMYAINGSLGSFDRKLLQEIISILESAGFVSNYYYLTRIKAEAASPLKPNLRKAIAACKSSEELERFVDANLSLIAGPLASLVALHPKVTSGVLEKVSNKIEWYAISGIINRYAKYPEFLGILLFNHPSSLTDALLFASQGPETVIKQILDLSTRHNRAAPVSALSSRFFTADLAKGLPARHIRSTEMPETAFMAVEELLEKTFGSRSDAWETFESLLESHEGTIGELIEMVAALVEIDSGDSKESRPPARLKSKPQDLNASSEPLF